MEDSSISSRVGERSTGKRQYENTVSYTEVKRRAFSVPSPKKAVMHKPVPPKSISVKQMLKLGNLVESPEVVNLYQFDLNRMTWSIITKPVEFNISSISRAYKAHTNEQSLMNLTYTCVSFKSGTCLIWEQDTDYITSCLWCKVLFQSSTRRRQIQLEQTPLVRCVSIFAPCLWHQCLAFARQSPLCFS